MYIYIYPLRCFSNSPVVLRFENQLAIWNQNYRIRCPNKNCSKIAGIWNHQLVGSWENKVAPKSLYYHVPNQNCHFRGTPYFQSHQIHCSLVRYSCSIPMFMVKPPCSGHSPIFFGRNPGLPKLALCLVSRWRRWCIHLVTANNWVISLSKREI